MRLKMMQWIPVSCRLMKKSISRHHAAEYTNMKNDDASISIPGDLIFPGSAFNLKHSHVGGIPSYPKTGPTLPIIPQCAVCNEPLEHILSVQCIVCFNLFQNFVKVTSIISSQ